MGGQLKKSTSCTPILPPAWGRSGAMGRTLSEWNHSVSWSGEFHGSWAGGLPCPEMSRAKAFLTCPLYGSHQSLLGVL